MSAATIHPHDSIGIIDIFAGPGGLGEGFSSFEAKAGLHPFRLGVSAEMERSAHATLRLRAFFRLLREKEGGMPTAYAKYLAAFAEGHAPPPEVHFSGGAFGSLWGAAQREALNITLGVSDHNSALYERIAAVKKNYGRIVLIGGPPCQAYSLVGRARNANVADFHARGDHRHFLYREYMQILARFAPDVFIMENVKGILSSTVGGRRMFDLIRRDLANPTHAIGGGRPGRAIKDEYVLLPIHVPFHKPRSADDVARDPSGFVIRCEEHGIPQARHRVIIMGVRADHADRAMRVHGLGEFSPIDSATALAGLPRLRSGLSRGVDDGERWAETVEFQRKRVLRALGSAHHALREMLAAVEVDPTLQRKAIHFNGRHSHFSRQLRQPGQDIVANHETRGHMPADLGRYLFSAAFGATHGCSPVSTEFPKALAPAHANWNSGHFSDRFRVQIQQKPASTVTSHLAKDGHAFIHWDPSQCRSLTVREAARLQTFPDDYVFLGNRTQQFVQVGNAVPPLIAKQIAGVIWSIFNKQRLS